MGYQVGYSDQRDVVSAVRSLKENLSEIENPGLVVYFVSPMYPVDEVSRLMAEEFPTAQTVGCTTAGEMISNKMLTGSIVAMACGRNSIPRFKIEILENISEDKNAVEKALKNMGNYFKTPVSALSPSRYVGIVMIDGKSQCEEYINEQIGAQTNVIFIGGSAGSNEINNLTYLCVNGKTYTNAAVLLLMEPVDGFSFLKMQSVVLTEKNLIATRTNESERVVYEFNNKPAAEAYADALNVSVSELQNYFISNPLGLVFDRKNIFVRDANRIIDNGAISFYCSIREGEELTVLQAGDIVSDARRDLEQAWFNNRNLKAIIEFNCMSRMKELYENNQEQKYAALFKSIPTIALGTFGESYIRHINQTSTMLFLK